MKSFEGDAADDVERVDDVTQRLAHLTTVSVADHGVKVNLLIINKNIIKTQNLKSFLVFTHPLWKNSDLILPTSLKVILIIINNDTGYSQV